METINHLFVYGTLMTGFDNQFATFLHERSTLIGTVTAKGKLYLVDYYPGAVFDEKSTSTIKGQLLRLHNPAEVLPKLDYYEGYDVSNKSNNDYDRVVLELDYANQKYTCFAYHYLRTTIGLPTISDGDFRKY